MTFLDQRIWHGKAFTGGWEQPGGGGAAVVGPATGAEIALVRIASPADIADATGWLTIRGDIAPYPF